MRRLAQAYTLIVVFAICGCDNHRAYTKQDSWYVPAASGVDLSPISKDKFAVVIDELQTEAQTTLSDVSAKKITAQEAARLAGKAFPSGAEYVILRAILLNEVSGSLTISVNKDTVRVHHGCLGRNPLPMKRKAIVAVLPMMPEKVYIDCNMAE